MKIFFVTLISENTLIFGITRFFYKQRLFSTKPLCYLIFSWIELQMLLRCCSMYISIIIRRHFWYLLYLCRCLDLGPFRSRPRSIRSTLIFIFIFIFINPILSWIQTHLFFCLFFLEYVPLFFDGNLDGECK